jgi:hypothetical protein
MKATVKIEQEIEIKSIRLALAVRCEGEDIPNDFPMRNGEMWTATVEIDTGKIIGWPVGKSGSVKMKVCDSGTYTLIGADGSTVAEIGGDYVPHGVVPGEYGDYVNLQINADGVITNWPKNPDVSAFFDI